MIHKTHSADYYDLMYAEAQPELGRRGHGPLRNKFSKVFTGALYQFSTVRKDQ